MTVIGYTRVSTSQQTEDGFSLQKQSEALSAYCRYSGLEEPEIIADEGISGRSLAKRKGMLSILERLGEIDHLVVYSLARLGRNTSELIEIAKKCNENKVTLHILDLKVDTSTATGAMFFTIMAAQSQFESDQRSELIRSQIKHNRNNRLRYSRPLLGFKNSGKTGKGQLEADVQEMGMVRKIFELKGHGLSLRAICNILQQEFKYIGKNGGEIGPATVKKVLDRKEIYQEFLT